MANMNRHLHKNTLYILLVETYKYDKIE